MHGWHDNLRWHDLPFTPRDRQCCGRTSVHPMHSLEQSQLLFNSSILYIILSNYYLIIFGLQDQRSHWKCNLSIVWRRREYWEIVRKLVYNKVILRSSDQRRKSHEVWSAPEMFFERKAEQLNAGSKKTSLCNLILQSNHSVQLINPRLVPAFSGYSGAWTSCKLLYARRRGTRVSVEIGNPDI